MQKILVTDSLFIFQEHEKQLHDAGYAIERIDKPRASEDELCEAIKGKVAYILGGVESVTNKVIEAADELKVIAFTGTDYKAFIPGWELAEKKNIKITNAPGANSFAVAEFAISVALAMQRNLFDLGRTGEATFKESKSLKGSSIGVIGAGNIGQKIIELIRPFEPSKIGYFSKSKKEISGAEYKDLDAVLKASDVLFIAIPESAGQVLDAARLKLIKPGCLIVNIGSKDLFDFDELLTLLKAGKIRVAMDGPVPSDEFTKLPYSAWFNTNDSTAYNTREANLRASDMAVKSLLSVLTDINDED